MPSKWGLVPTQFAFPGWWCLVANGQDRVGCNFPIQRDVAYLDSQSRGTASEKPTWEAREVRLLC